MLCTYKKLSRYLASPGTILKASPRPHPPSPIFQTSPIRVHLFGDGSSVAGALEQAADACSTRCSGAFVEALLGDGREEVPCVVTEASPVQEGPLVGVPTYDLGFSEATWEV